MAQTICGRLSGFPREEIEEVVSALWARLLEANCARLKSFRGRNGAAFGIEEETVYVRLSRAFAKLRKELTRRGLDCACAPKDASSQGPCEHRHFSGKRVVRLMETMEREDSLKLCRADMSGFCPLCRKTFLSTALMWHAFAGRRFKAA